METAELVLKILKQSDISLTEDEIARKARIKPATASRCLIILQSKGLVEKREIGRTRLYAAGIKKRGIF
ncbi:MAG: MarR family transcriptional regulator [Candidatus Aenigmarchaeota archaeon]|nr:MarR family transcriptional regulator [Candidatus Aenigmarchaeota archaeon]